MVPPLSAARLRSIARYLSDVEQMPQPDASILARACEIDDAMIEAFETREDVLKEAMMKLGTWGTEKGMTSFPLERMILWREVLEEFLPLMNTENSESQ